MDPLTLRGHEVPEPQPDPSEEVAWLRVDDASAAPAVRRRAVEVAERVGLGEARVGEVAVVATELATNLARHATDGVAVVRLLRRDGIGGVGVLTLDRGPGMRDVRAVLSDGTSSRGTLGIGLGAVERLSTSVDLHSQPGHGTVVSAELWPHEHPLHPSPSAGLLRPLHDDEPCGDAWAERSLPGGGHLAVLADGLGHGALAHKAAAAATRAFHETHDDDPAVLLQRMHRALAGTRGAAVLVVRTAGGEVASAGVGNVVGRLLGRERTRTLPSSPGIVGSNLPRVRTLVQPADDVLRVVLHSDGLTDRWDPARLPGLVHTSPVVLAATLLREAGTRRDDAGILVRQVGR